MPDQPHPSHPTQIPLWRQLQGAAAVLMAVRNGQSMTPALEECDAQERPGVQALSFHVMRHLGHAQALRSQLAKKPPPPEADALLCVVLALICTAPSDDMDGVEDSDDTVDALARPASAGPSYAAYTLVDQAVEAAKRSEATRHQASFINGCLRRFLREQDALMAQVAQVPQAQWNHPQWWLEQVRKDHPTQWQAILQANNAQPAMILRVNERKMTQSQYIRALHAMDIVASPVGACGVILDKARPVTALPGFAEGHFSVQDAAAQLAAPMLLESLRRRPDSPARLNLLDACAAPGGKTAHLLELADADVTALDVDARRCERMTQNLARLGLQAHIVVGDAASPQDWWDGRAYDGILLDAPCTASGIVRRHPDVRWLRRPSDIPQLAAIQARLLAALWPLLKPGGSLVYCTCSVFKAEGERQVQTFVAHHNDAVFMPSPGHLLPQSGVGATVFPDNLVREHDGFFYALLEKRDD